MLYALPTALARWRPLCLWTCVQSVIEHHKCEIMYCNEQTSGLAHFHLRGRGVPVVSYLRAAGSGKCSSQSFDFLSVEGDQKKIWFSANSNTQQLIAHSAFRMLPFTPSSGTVEERCDARRDNAQRDSGGVQLCTVLYDEPLCQVISSSLISSSSGSPLQRTLALSQRCALLAVPRQHHLTVCPPHHHLHSAAALAPGCSG